MRFELTVDVVDMLASSGLAMERPDVVETLRHPVGWTPPSGVRPARALVAMQVDEWWVVDGWLTRLSVVEVGSTRDERLTAQKAQRADERLTRAIRDLTAHPAYRGLGVPGREPTILEAHQIDGDARWWPSRRQALLGGAKAGIDSTAVISTALVPKRVRIKGRYFTRWELHPPKASTKKGLAATDPSSSAVIASP